MRAAFEVASAYVRVDPDASGFESLLEGQIGGLDYVVKVPVVPDTQDFAGEVDAAVAESRTAVQVPVVPDTGDFKLLIDSAVAQAKTSVDVPVVPDMAGFAPAVEAEAAAAGEAAGLSFDEKLSAAMAAHPPEIWPEAAADAGAAGEASGAAFSERFAAAANSAALFPAAAVERDAGVAAEASGGTFAEKFSAMLAGGAGLMDRMIPGMEAEAAAGGAVAGESFMGKFKGVIAGDIPVMEVLLGAGFVAATAVMATHFQAAMELVHTQAGVAQSAIAGLSGSVLSLAGQVGESPNSLAAALYHVESSFQSTGISGQKAMDLVRIAAEGARTGGANLVDVTNALDATIVAGVPGISSYSQAMGALNAIVGTGDMKMQDLADAMGTGLMAAGKAYGQSIYQIGAALATLGDNNIRGAKAATDLRMAWQAVEAPMKGGIPVLNSLGLSAHQLADEMTQHGLTGALQMFVGHLQSSHVPINQWGQIVTEVFGKRAGVGIQVLIDQLERMKGKLPDIENAAHGFGSAWAATQQTTSQKLAELRGSFDSLAIKIGSALLPVINRFLGDVNNALPGIEKFGTSLAHLVAPVVSAFFQGLGAVVKELVSFLTRNAGSLEKFGRELVKLALPVVHTFFSNLLAVIKLLVGDIEGWLPHFEKLAGIIAKLAIPAVGLFFTGLGAILKLLLGPLKDVTLAVGLFAAAWVALNAVMAINPFVAIGIALVILVGLIVKYHKQIWDAIKGAWDKVYGFLKNWWYVILPGILTGGFGAIVGLIIKYHKQIFDTIKQWWGDIEKFFTQDVGGFFTKTIPGWWDDVIKALNDHLLKPLEDGFKTAWNWVVTNVGTPISTFFTKTLPGWWDDAIRFLKDKLITPLENGLKTAWDWVVTNVGTPIHDFFTQTLPGWWDTAVGFVKSHFVTPFENAFKTAWNWVMTNVFDPVDTFFTKTLPGWFDTARTDIKNIWNGILQDITGIVNKIEQVVGGILSLPGKAISGAGKLLGAIGLAGGGVVPGFAPGKDSFHAMLSPGEAVLVPEAVRAIGPARIHAINAAYSRHRGGGSMALGGIIPGYAGGGVVTPSAIPQAIASGILQVLSQVAGQAAPSGTLGAFTGGGAGIPQPYGYGVQGAAGGDGKTINVYFMGTQWPTAEQQQAMMTRLSAAVGVS